MGHEWVEKLAARAAQMIKHGWLPPGAGLVDEKRRPGAPRVTCRVTFRAETGPPEARRRRPAVAETL